MTNAEAIQTLKLMQAQVEWEYPMDYAAAIDEAIDALEKQQPMETGPDELGISARNPVITPCGNCGTELTDRMWSYCPWCGQKIKWRKR